MYILIRVLEQKQIGTESKLEIDRNVCVWVGGEGVREMFLSGRDEDVIYVLLKREEVANRICSLVQCICLYMGANYDGSAASQRNWVVVFFGISDSRSL